MTTVFVGIAMLLISWTLALNCSNIETKEANNGRADLE